MIVDRKTVVFIARMPANGISGGRYHTLIMAEAIAALGYDVVIWTNVVPAFSEEFKDLPGHEAIKFHVDPNFRNPPRQLADVLVFVPHLVDEDEFFEHGLNYAKKSGSQILFLNFESPNWFNSVAEAPRNEHLWTCMSSAARWADMVLSSCEESDGWAKKYYTYTDPNCLFRWCYPSVHSPMIASLGEIKRKANQVICISRFDAHGTHKGGEELLEILNAGWRGRRLVMICGHSPSGPLWEKVCAAAKAHQVELVLATNISEKEKFVLLKESSLMLFLSRFEGFGYPPIEAVWCGLPCIAFDLPVLRETVGNLTILIDRKDTKSFVDKVEQILRDGSPLDTVQAKVDALQKATSFETYQENLDKLLRELIRNPSPAIASAQWHEHIRWKITPIRTRLRKRLSRLRSR